MSSFRILVILAALAMILPGPASAETGENGSPEASELQKPEAAPTLAEEPERPALPASREDLSVEELTRRVRRSVVVITSAGRDGRREGMGSGFVVSADGLVATNFHVIGRGRDIGVELPDGRTIEVAGIHASDRALDLAVLRVDADDLVPLELGDSDEVKQGQSVIALGNPQGLKNSVVSGVVSDVREMDGRPMIQLAIPIEQGNSGGPLVDMRGRVQGLLSMKSLVTPNLGFAVAVNLLKPLLDKPNPIPMSRWLTIGALDSRRWQPIMGARWRQRAGRITVEGTGEGFGGRSLCLFQGEVPKRPFELAVTVRLDDESGAAGLAFSSDGEHRHMGFYPSGGHLRLTNFDGPDVTRWVILHDRASPHYAAGEWNTLRVRLEEGKIRCFVNDQPVVELPDVGLKTGNVGLVKFRGTKAQFKDFEVGREVPRVTVPPRVARRIEQLVEMVPEDGPLDERLVRILSVEPDTAAKVLRQRAATLDRQARQLRKLAEATHQRRVVDDLVEELSDKPDEEIDLFRAGLLVARLDNEEVDVDAYCREVEQMAEELAAKLTEKADDAARLEALRKYLFQENGFHGSRSDFYNRANSYLNEVLDDREGLPVTLSVVYMELARRVGLNVVGIGLPGHFVVAYVPAEGERQLIDVFDGATKVSRAEAERRVREATDGTVSDERLDELFQGVSKRDIIFRMLSNLLGLSRGDPPALHRYLNAMLAIEPTHGPYHWLRAMVRYELDERESARDDVAWLLENEPEGVNLDPVRALQRELDRPQ